MRPRPPRHRTCAQARELRLARILDRAQEIGRLATRAIDLLAAPAPPQEALDALLAQALALDAASAADQATPVGPSSTRRTRRTRSARR